MSATSAQRPRIRVGIRQKVLLVLVGVLIVAVGTTSWLNLRQQERDILKETRQHGEDVVRLVSQSLAYSVIGYDYHSIQLLLDEVVKSQDIVHATVTNAKGHVMAEAGQIPENLAPSNSFSRAIELDDKPIGRLSVILDNGRIVSKLEEQKRSMVIREVLLVVLIAIGEFLALSYIIVRPVRIISTSLSNGVGSDGQANDRIDLDSNDEFGRLARQFNDLSVRLNEANVRLHSKVQVADQELVDSNRQLSDHSEELQRINDELKRMTVTDALTGLYNRRYFEELMENELALSMRHGETNSMLVVDLDHFKTVNDTYGHRAGDIVLQSVAILLGSDMRRTDIICRVGGEEFVALCRRVDQQEAIRLAEKLRTSIETHEIEVDFHRLHITASIGVATMPDGGEVSSGEEFFRRADTALYFSKKNGRNRVTHFAAIRGRDAKRPKAESGGVR